MDTLKLVQNKMNLIIVERCIRTALTRNIPPAADQTKPLVEEVLMFSELRKESIGPLNVIHYQGRIITL